MATDESGHGVVEEKGKETRRTHGEGWRRSFGTLITMKISVSGKWEASLLGSIFLVPVGVEVWGKAAWRR
jgi:hypothetical protein